MDIFLFSGACGCGKSTLSKAYAEKHAAETGRQVYIIHGDDIHAGFVGEAQTLSWMEILRFNWECILSIARKALAQGLDVVIDYVVEDELPLVKKLAEEHGARLCYVVLTADEDTLRQRITARGDTELIPRSLFLRERLMHMPENQGHLFDNTGMTAAQVLAALDMQRFAVGP